MTESGFSPAVLRAYGRAGLMLSMGLAVAAGLRAADTAEVRRELNAGKYADVIKQAGAVVHDSPGDSGWDELLVRAQLATGQNAAAEAAVTAAFGRDPGNIQLRWLARQVALANGKPDEAAARVDEVRKLVAMRPRMYGGARDLVIYGRAALLLGADPKDVLDKLYGPAQKADPKAREVYLARGELALDKHDFALAAKAYEEGVKELPDDVDLQFGLALAYAGSDREATAQALTTALKINPRHVPSLLQLADHAIDGEDYAGADKRLEQVLEINPTQPDAWAYRAVLAHLRNDAAGEAEARQSALQEWATNPRVDSLIGRKLAEKYRFAEGAAYQRRALEFDSNYLPATTQLASDLLRLGNEEEGWRLAQTVHERDEYDVEAYNLVTLHDTMAKYATLANEDFVVRMSAKEAAIYGPRVLEMLTKAKRVLTTKYSTQIARPTYVEIFADQKDFAVRTFGMPDIPGFLGVCFGRVVTANGPAATGGHAVNWEAVLWHEFCHVVTLQLTHNKMPRWLSEGISVYEETQANRAWGMQLTPHYREMIAKDELTPVGSLSAAFLSPKNPEHLQFAYLESELVVEYIVNRHGIAALRGVLGDLGEGMPINAALEKNVEALPKLETNFTAYVQDLAKQLAPKMDWERPDQDLLLPDASAEFAAWAAKRPDNYWALMQRARTLAKEQNWAEVKTVLTHVVELYPTLKGVDSPYRPLVAALHSLGETDAEREVLKRWAPLDDEATDAYLRLMELGAAAKDWATVAINAERYLQVNPLVPAPWRYLAQATAATGDTPGGVVAWRTLIQLDPPDPAEAHYQLAKLVKTQGEVGEARWQTVLALEEAPRYREALKLLWELKQTDPTPLSKPTGGGSIESMKPNLKVQTSPLPDGAPFLPGARMEPPGDGAKKL